MRRKWIITADALAAITPALAMLRDVGAPHPFVIACNEGTGDLPQGWEAEIAVLDAKGDTMMEGIRAFEAALRDLPADVVDRIEAWDPERAAVILGPITESALVIAGRPSWGARSAGWAAIEDKTTVDALWDAAGITRAPSRIVPTTHDALLAAANALDQGSGTVWVADNRDGWHGGGSYVRWVPRDEPGASAAAFMANNADRARVMPYLVGIPCSIHAMVMPDGVAALRPVEIMSLREPATGQFRYMGVSTGWDPPQQHREEMRSVARRAASHLQETVGYRGAMGIDGVLTSDGFRPTELNPRYSPGMGVQAAAAGFSMLTLQRAATEQDDLDYRTADLEGVVVAAADAARVVHPPGLDRGRAG